MTDWDTCVMDAFEASESGAAPGRAAPSGAALTAAERWLERSVPVVIPTETVYGLAARASDRSAVRAVFEVKGRPADNPLIVHVTREAHLAAIGAALSPLAAALAREFWPGPLTLIVPCRAELGWVTAGLDSVAIRHPDHPFAAALIDRAGPLAAPSANRSGRPSPTRASHAVADLGGRVPLVVDGGALEHGLESTVLDVRGEVPVLLRPGALPVEALEAECERSIALAGHGTEARSPGMKYRHYSPRAELWLYPPNGDGVAACERLVSDARRLASQGRRVGVIGSEPVEVARFIARPRDPNAYARGLFLWLRELDALGVDAILVEGVSPSGVGRAVMDRLSRAATRLCGDGGNVEGERREHS